jgi:hypothetical protein
MNPFLFIFWTDHSIRSYENICIENSSLEMIEIIINNNTLQNNTNWHTNDINCLNRVKLNYSAWPALGNVARGGMLLRET